MSQKDRQAWAAMLDADPKLRVAWNGFTSQLAKDEALIAQAAEAMEAIATAAQAVHEAAGTGQVDSD